MEFNPSNPVIPRAGFLIGSDKVNKFKNIYVLDENRDIFMVLSNYLEESLEILDDLYERDMDSYVHELTITVNGSNPLSGDIKAGMFFFYPKDNINYSMFKIMEVSESTDGEIYEKVYKSKSVDHIDLLKGFCDPTTFTSASVEDVMKYILLDTNFYFGYTDLENDVNFTIDNPVTKLQALIDFCDQNDLEFDFEYELNGNIIVKRSINVVSEIGQDLGKVFIRDIDLLSVEREEDRNKLVTAMKGYAVVDGQRISFKDLSPKLPSGYSFIKGSDYIVSDKAFENYAVDGVHLWGVFNDPEARSPQELFDNTLKTLQKYDKPLYTYQVGVVYLNDLLDKDYIPYGLGDKVLIQDKTLVPELYLQARIRKLATSIYHPEKGEITLGDYIAIAPKRSDAIDRLQDQINKQESQWNAQSHSLRIVSSGGQFFKNRDEQVTLTAMIIKDGVDIDTLGTKYTYIWSCRDIKGLPIKFPDGSLTKQGKHIVVTGRDFESTATFKVDTQIEI